MDDSPTQRDSWDGAPLDPRPRRHSKHEELTQSRSSATQHRDKPDSATTTKTHHQKEWTALPREAHGTVHQYPRPRGRSNHEELTQSRPSATQHRDKPDSATTTKTHHQKEWTTVVEDASTFLATSREKTFCCVASCEEAMPQAQFSSATCLATLQNAARVFVRRSVRLKPPGTGHTGFDEVLREK